MASKTVTASQRDNSEIYLASIEFCSYFVYCSVSAYGNDVGKLSFLFFFCRYDAGMPGIFCKPDFIRYFVVFSYFFMTYGILLPTPLPDIGFTINSIFLCSPSDSIIGISKLFHLGHTIEITPIKYDFVFKGFFYISEFRYFKFLPLGYNDERIRSF